MRISNAIKVPVLPTPALIKYKCAQLFYNLFSILRNLDLPAMYNNGASDLIFVVQSNTLVSHCVNKINELFRISWTAKIWPFRKVHLLYKLCGTNISVY